MARPAYERLGTAFRDAYKAAGLRQEDIAARLGVDQGTISKWGRGLQRIPLDVLPIIDEMCGRTTGHVLRLAGYVKDDPADVRAAIRADPTLNGLLQDVMLSTYDGIQRALATSDIESAKPDSAVPSS